MSSRKKIEEGRHLSVLNNPCVKEQQLSLKCLENNNYDRDKCTLYFENYKNCANFWSNVYAARRRKGIRPYLPEPEKREEIKQEYLKTQMGR